ncbi:anti-sigma F factor [Vallitalea okinawensis]|uniref:anti-sigma F factor n=1 Tax=Vallitalea okinawensis TaxID=2078660 RepID=UPI000CFE3386|nr:anti-sigma F factor [Vallitalea okinawensis]
MTEKNSMQIQFDSKSQNVSFARVAVASFISQLDPTLQELSDIKTAVSEAVTNAIIHGYDNQPGTVHIACSIEDDLISILIEDQGIGIEDIDKAKEPLYTSKPELERSGMGFTFMDTFMDKLLVDSELGKGTKIHMKKRLKR